MSESFGSGPSQHRCPGARWSFVSIENEAQVFEYGTRTYGRWTVPYAIRCSGCGHVHYGFEQAHPKFVPHPPPEDRTKLTPGALTQSLARTGMGR